MLQDIRDNSSSLAFRVVIFLIIFVMAVFGFQAVNFFSTGGAGSIYVNGEEIPAIDIEMQVARQVRALQAQGQDIDPERVRPQVMQQQIDRTLLLQEVERGGIGAHAELIDDEIRSSPSYQLDGVYDPVRLRQLLLAQGITEAEFRAGVAEDLRLRQLVEGIGAGEFLTEEEVRHLLSLLEEQRSVAWLTIDRDGRVDPAAITDAELQAAWAARRTEYTIDEQVVVDYVVLDRYRIAAAQTPTEAEIQQRYARAAAAFEPVEERRARQIVLDVGVSGGEEADTGLGARVQQQLMKSISDTIFERLEAGESFAALAAEYSADTGTRSQGGDLGFAPRGVYGEEIERVLWTMQPGEIEGPIETDFGWLIVKLEDVRRTEYPSFEADRARIVRELQLEAAEPIYLDRLTRLRELAFESVDLQPLAAYLDTEPERSEPFSMTTGQGIFADPRVRDVAFSEDVLANGYNSEVLEITPDRAIVMRLNERIPARVPELEEVEAELRLVLAEEAAESAVRTQAEAVLADLRSGMFARDVAEQHGLQWSVTQPVARSSTDVDPAIIEATFRLPPPGPDQRALGTADLGERGMAVLVLSEVTQGDPAILQEAQLSAFRSALLTVVINRASEALRSSLRREADIAGT